jgi:hypothetical protein
MRQSIWQKKSVYALPPKDSLGLSSGRLFIKQQLQV